MAKKKKEKVVEETTKSPKGMETKGDVKQVLDKMKTKPVIEDDNVVKVNLDKVNEEKESVTKVNLDNAVQEPKTDEVDVQEPTKDSEQVVEEVQDTEERDTVQDETTPVVEEITGKVEEVTEQVTDAIIESEATGKPLPESVEKLMSFIEETGGDINDYVKLNQDYSEMDNQTLLQEYYKQTKPHLKADEIDFLMEDQFSYDEEVDEEKDIKRKKLALKEQVADAKKHLDGLKSKYYEEIKGGSKLTKQQQEAINFYNKYTKEAEETERYEKQAKTNFLNKTNRFFGDKFKGFEYNVGEKRFRFNVNDVSKVKEKQSDISNFIGKFLDENQQIKDEAGYHKSLFTAMNPDTVANHFYEQGKADALKQSITDSKNVSMTPRQELGESQDNSGIKVRVLGENTADFKFKIKNK